MKKIKITIFHPGLQHAPRLVKELKRELIEVLFLTSCIFSQKNKIAKYLSKLNFFNFKAVRNRLFTELDFKNVKSYYSVELFGILFKDIYKRNLYFQKKIKFHRWIKSEILIGFDTSSYYILKRVKRFNQLFILDQTTPHHNLNLQLNEILNLEVSEKSQLELDNQNLEHQLADVIVVASEFTKKSLIDNGVHSDKIYVIPYGVDLEKFSYKERSLSKKLIFVYVGNVNKRKGIELLLQSWNVCNHAYSELWIIGPSNNFLMQETPKNVKFFGKVLNSELKHLLDQANVFIFPSYFDGFGLVILEAMACGLPVIASTNCGGPDIIEHGIEGFIFEAGNATQLTSKINFFLENPQSSIIMGEKARKKAENFSWKEYGNQWNKLITVISNKCS